MVSGRNFNARFVNALIVTIMIICGLLALAPLWKRHLVM
jgi:hypothetical protein